MSFQYLFDNATSIGIDKKPTVAQSITRDRTVRSLARGGATWRFTVTMPDGMPYDDWRSELASIEALDRTTTATVRLNNSVTQIGLPVIEVLLHPLQVGLLISVLLVILLQTLTQAQHPQTETLY